MRYTGFLGKSFSGDPAKSSLLMGAARNLVGQVRQQLCAAPFNGTGALARRRPLPDGGWINVWVCLSAGREVIRAWITTPTAEQVVEVKAPGTTVATESGYLQWDDLTQDVDFGVTYDADLADWLGYSGCEQLGDAYLTPRGQLAKPRLYSLTRDRKSIVIDEQPNSFWTDRVGGSATAEACSNAKRSAVLGSTSYPFQHCTGKMRLYQQAKLGAELTATGCCFTANRYVQTDGNSGILKDPLGNYWIAEIDTLRADPVVGFRAITLDTVLQGKIASAIARGDFQAEVEAETKAFACSVVATSQSYVMPILDSDGNAWVHPDYGDSTRTVARPLAHGWKFSWDTNRAAICLLRNVSASNSYYWINETGQIESRVYEITFNWGSVFVDNVEVWRWLPTIALIELAQFRVRNDWDWWFMLVGRTSSTPWSMGDAPSGAADYGDPVNAPVYCFYTATERPHIRNNTLSVCRVSRYAASGDQVIVTNPYSSEYDGNHYKMCGDSPVVYDSSEQHKSDLRYGVSFAGTVTSGGYYGYLDYTRMSDVDLSHEWVYGPIADIETNYFMVFAVSYDNETGGTVHAPQVSNCQYSDFYADLPPGLGSDPGVDYDVCFFSGGWTRYTGQLTRSNGDLKVAIAIPLTDAESVIVCTENLMRKTETGFSAKYNRDTWGSRLHSVGGYAVTGYIGYIYNVFVDGKQLGYTAYNDAKGSVTVYGKSGAYAPLELTYNLNTLSSEMPKGSRDQPCLLQLPMQYWISFKQQLDPDWSAGMTIVQGIGAAKKMNTRVTEGSLAQDGTPYYTPTLKEWLRETAVAGGWPRELAEDDHTHPIGWA